MHMLYSNYMVLFMLVDLQSQCMQQVSEPVDICLGKVLKKSLNWWMWSVYSFGIWVVCVRQFLVVFVVSVSAPWMLIYHKVVRQHNRGIIGSFSDYFIANSVPIVPAKELWKSMRIWARLWWFLL